MLEFDGVFDGDDALAAAAIDLADDGGQRGRFTRAGGARDDDDAAVEIGEGFDLRREVEVVEVGDLGHDAAHDDRVLFAAVKHVGAEARDAGHGVGDIDRALVLEDAALVGWILLGVDDLIDVFLHQLIG
jgi:hypothetical protein